MKHPNGPRCDNTRSFWGNCGYCSEEVFWHLCDCGVKVTFDYPGHPWPVHRCAEYEQGWLKPESGLRVISKDKSHESTERGNREKVKQKIANKKRSSKKKSRLIRQDPYHNLKTTEQGDIIGLIWNADIFKKADVTGSLSVAMLGKYAKVKLAQITIHARALAEDEDDFSYTFFVEETTVRKQGLAKGNFVTAKLRGIGTLIKHPIWVCDKLTG